MKSTNNEIADQRSFLYVPKLNPRISATSSRSDQLTGIPAISPDPLAELTIIIISVTAADMAPAIQALRMCFSACCLVITSHFGSVGAGGTTVLPPNGGALVLPSCGGTYGGVRTTCGGGGCGSGRGSAAGGGEAVRCGCGVGGTGSGAMGSDGPAAGTTGFG